MPRTDSEAHLVSQAEEGKTSAFSELVLRHRQHLVNLVYQMCGDASSAEEAAQEAFIHAWQNLPSYQPHSPLRNWLARIAANRALDRLHRDQHWPSLDNLSLAATDPSPEDIAQERETAATIQRAVLDLPPASRAVLILREYAQLSYQEIAHTLDIPEGTVMSRLSYARNSLRQSLSYLLEDL
jgi:RNA polymerase sigma-70 factor (ECF subfamily)